MSEAISDIQTLASSLEALTLEELRKGPRWQSGLSPALEYPPLPDAGDDNLCYLLGWPLHDVSERLMTIAGCEVKRLGEPDYNEALTQAMHYMWNWGDYHHSWTAVVPKDSLKSNELIDPAVNDTEEDIWFLAISCTEESGDNRVDRRPNKAQFEWFRKVLGKDPCWVLFDRSLYTIVEDSVWKRAPCCSKWGKGKPHLVDLETGKWKHDQE